MSPIYRSFAKVNLHLRVMARRPDGYHDLETVFQSVELADHLMVELTTPGVELRVLEGSAPRGADNLAYRAAAAFLGRWSPDRGVALELRKRIPVGGGLGGGSSNAATVLIALQDLLGYPAPSDELVRLARHLGADVPYFLVGGTALGMGRGDEVLALDDLPERQVLLVTPAVEISTAAVYRELDRTRRTGTTRQRIGLDSTTFSWEDVPRGWNDLEAPVMARYPEVRAVYNELVEAGAMVVRLSGSGATLFALLGDAAELSRLPSRLPTDSRVILTRTLSRSSLVGLRVVQ